AAAGCSTIALFPLAESLKDNPKAVIGLTDFSAREYILKILGATKLSFSLPFKLFKEMEENVNQSFLTNHFWLDYSKNRD
ncbi:MAG: DUF169 domain-containing protein, partial [Deltaproteobacteria bacterium]|nr:DUF169 domain-containing protein [Deltaproteobacteria bacterium]